MAMKTKTVRRKMTKLKRESGARIGPAASAWSTRRRAEQPASARPGTTPCRP